MENGKNYEILSPAGSIEQLIAAVNNGCDSVYLGLNRFNARMKAPNFDSENLARWMDYCHFYGVKVYVAINTSIKNDEFSIAAQTLLDAYQKNADGAIITDLSLLQFAATLPKPFDIIASTQLNTHDGFGARFLKKLGATTVVCARESSFEEVEEIAASNLNVECFLHGALCVCQSGQCLFSSMVGGNSGNRGLCAQPCRKLYKTNIGKFRNGGYMLSASDICGLDTAKKLHQSGVSTFKIEGRNRRAEYAGATAKVYSEFFRRDFRKEKGDIVTLKEVFNRGDLPPCSYLWGKNDGIVYPLAQNHIGVEVGKIVEGKVFATTFLTKGDGLKIMDGGREVCGGSVLQSGQGVDVKCEFSGKVANGMSVRRTSSVQMASNILSARRKRSVSVCLEAFGGTKATLTIISDGISVKEQSDFVVQKAIQSPTDSAELELQLCKIGETPFEISDVKVRCDNVFVAKSQINGLRRSAFEKLTEKIISQYNSAFENRKTLSADVAAICGSSLPKESRKCQNCLAVVCNDGEQLRECADFADYLIFKPNIVDEATLAQTDLPSVASKCFLDLPSFSDNTFVSDILHSKRIGVVCHNIGQVQMARENSVRYIAGAGLNIFNDRMAEVFGDAETFFYSQELTLAEIAAFTRKDGLIFVDGDLILMKLVHCPFKAATDSTCANCQAHRKLTYTDELGNEFLLRRRKDKRCTFELVNGKKLSVASKLTKGGRYCVDFDREVVAHFVNLNKGICDSFVEHRPHTKGRLFSKIN